VSALSWLSHARSDEAGSAARTSYVNGPTTNLLKDCVKAGQIAVDVIERGYTHGSSCIRPTLREATSKEVPMRHGSSFEL
jgi:hypothetical protein